MKKLVILVLFLWLFGCTSYHAKVGDAEITMNYFLQNKQIKSFSFDPNTGRITIENFGSETSQIVETALSTVLKGGK